jgi:hypothetical protein
MSSPAITSTWEKALGSFVVSKSAVSAMTDRLTHAYDALQNHDLGGFAIA